MQIDGLRLIYSCLELYTVREAIYTSGTYASRRIFKVYE